jgi:transposase
MPKASKGLVMFPLSPNAKIFLYAPPTNMRKSFEGLCHLIEETFSEKPTSEAFFIFINRRKDSMKVLYWDEDGLAIWYKRLEKGTFPRNKKTVLSRRDFVMLLEGIIPKRLNRRYSKN